MGLLNYRDPMGTNFQLKTAVEWLQTQGVQTTIHHTAIVSGVQNGLAVTLAAFFLLEIESLLTDIPIPILLS